jgi:antitoxin component of MazEF toxin-antitoxin module
VFTIYLFLAYGIAINTIEVLVMLVKSLKLKEGDEMICSLNNNELTLIPIKTSLRKVREMINLYHDPNISLVDKLILERRVEAKNE